MRRSKERAVTRLSIGLVKALSLIVMLTLVGCGGNGSSDGGQAGSGTPTPVIEPAFHLSQVAPLTITVTTTSIVSGTGRFEKGHTCEGINTSPPLEWQGVPPDAKSLVLIFEDPASYELDGRGLWTHWILYSIPPEVTGLSVGQSAVEVLDIGAVQGTNDYGTIQYSGPCPIPNLWWGRETQATSQDIVVENTRSAPERSYFLRLYAIDTGVDLGPGATREEILREIDGHILAAGEAELPYRTRKRIHVAAGCAMATRTLLEAAKCIERPG